MFVGQERRPRFTHHPTPLHPSSVEAEKHIDNAIKRILKCSPPEGLRERAWTATGEKDQNGLDIFKSNFHTCGVENWNAMQTGFVPGGNCKKETATAYFYEGNARLITKKEVPPPATRPTTLITTTSPPPQPPPRHRCFPSCPVPGAGGAAGGSRTLQPDSTLARERMGGPR